MVTITKYMITQWKETPERRKRKKPTKKRIHWISTCL